MAHARTATRTPPDDAHRPQEVRLPLAGRLLARARPEREETAP